MQTCTEIVAELKHSWRYIELKWAPALLNGCRALAHWICSRLWWILGSLHSLGDQIFTSSPLGGGCFTPLALMKLCPSFHCVLFCRMRSSEAVVPFCLAKKRQKRCRDMNTKSRTAFFIEEKKNDHRGEKKATAGIFSQPTLPVFLQFLHLIQTLINSQSNSSRGWNLTNNPLGECQG